MSLFIIFFADTIVDHMSVVVGWWMHVRTLRTLYLLCTCYTCLWLQKSV